MRWGALLDSGERSDLFSDQRLSFGERAGVGRECMCCPLMWHLPRFVWLIRHALSRDPSLSFAFQSL